MCYFQCSTNLERYYGLLCLKSQDLRLKHSLNSQIMNRLKTLDKWMGSIYILRQIICKSSILTEKSSKSHNKMPTPETILNPTESKSKMVCKLIKKMKIFRIQFYQRDNEFYKGTTCYLLDSK